MPRSCGWVARHPLPRRCCAELLGTWLLCLFGTGSVAAAVVSGAQQGLWQVAAVWGWGVAIAIFCTAGVSGAHLNPAVSLTFALLRPAEFPRRWLLPYAAAQLAGAALASLVVWGCWHAALADFEQGANLTRGAAGSERAAMIFGEYFPNPGSPLRKGAVPSWLAFFVEALGTGVLMFVIFAVTNPQNAAGPQQLAPLFIGMTVACLISLFAPLTQAGWNPARDWGPRLVALAAGYGDVAFPGPRGGCWVYLLGPLVGAPLGGLLHDALLRDAYGAGDAAAASPVRRTRSRPEAYAADAERPTEPAAAACADAGDGGFAQLCAPGEACAPGVQCRYFAPVGTAVRVPAEDVRALLLAASRMVATLPHADPAQSPCGVQR